MSGFSGSIGGAGGARPINGTSQGMSKGPSGANAPAIRGGYNNGSPNPNSGASNPGGDASRFPSLGGNSNGK